MVSRSESSSRSVVLGGLRSRNVSSVRGKGFEERRLAKGTSSINRRSMHVVLTKEDNGSEEPAGAGGGAVESGGSVVMIVLCWSKYRQDPSSINHQCVAINCSEIGKITFISANVSLSLSSYNCVSVGTLFVMSAAVIGVETKGRERIKMTVSQKSPSRFSRTSAARGNNDYSTLICLSHPITMTSKSPPT